MAGTWQPLLNQPGFRADTMLLLTDGTVMCHELNTNMWHRFTPDGTGNYVNGTWSSLKPMSNNSAIPASKGGPTFAPLYFASAVLRDGTVFVAGGEYNTPPGGIPIPNSDLVATEIYDPVSDSWTIVNPPTGWTAIGDAPSCVLPDGRLLLGSILDLSTAIYDPVTQSWTAAANKGDSSSEEGYTLLPDGTVLTVQCSNIPNAEKFVGSSWVSAGATLSILPQACPGLVAEIGPAILLPDGRVFAIGATGNTALFTPASGWTAGPTLVDSSGSTSFPMDAPAVLLPNGKVLCVGGPSPPCNFPPPTTFFEYDPASNVAAVITSPPTGGSAPFEGRFLLLPSGQVLFSNNSPNVQVYTPGGVPNAAWKPTIISFPATMLAGNTYIITGTQFNGLSQACSYGDDAQMATNYPIVRVTNASTGTVTYLRTFNHSTMAVATGATTVSTNIDIPRGIQPGCADVLTLEVIANGIPSVSVPIAIQPRPSESWAVSWGAGRLDVFGAGENNDDLLQRSWTTPLPPPTSLGGTLWMIYPSAVSSNTGRLDVFGAGENRDLLQWSFNGGWAGPVSLGGTLGNLFPSAVSWGPGRLDVFAAGGNSELLRWTSVDGGSTWAGPVPFDSGMWTNSKPCVVSWGPGRLDVFGVGFNHELLHRWFDTTTGPAGNVESLGGNLLFSTSQSAVSSKTGHLDVFGVGENNELLWWSFNDPGPWAGPVSFDSGMWTPSKPCVVSSCSGRLNVFGEGENNVLLHKLFDPGTGWNAPESLGGTLLTGAAPAAVSSNARQLDVFGLGQNHDLLHWSSVDDGSSWTAPVSLDPGTWRSDVD